MASNIAGPLLNTAKPRLIQRIVQYPHPALRHRCRPLRQVDAELWQMVAEMLELMYERDGVGLAANQVDLPYRLFVMNPTGDRTQKEQEFVLINPEILSRKGGMEEKEEGCLSLPGIFAPVRRSSKIVLAAYNLQGQEVKYEFEGLAARAAQHELDHLDGVLFIDRLRPACLAEIREKLLELEQEFRTNRRLGLIPDDAQIAARLAALEALRT
ncbi:MAG: peptide deformylase [Thermoguttaceae bacterium]|nr:peptide deformylase [Thermoguttaceae bacterium]MDW8037809.1 peptide deformylase [Thermoguttaceae bacterium]